MTHAEHPNARFWAFINGSQVKITLKPGQYLEHHRHFRTDEGWASYGTTWEHEGDLIRRYWGSAAKDCDGRIITTGEDVCEIDLLRLGKFAKSPLRW